jgi:N-acyl-L-homoserine lactone synthetase
MPALMSGLQEFCRSNGVQAVVGVTRKHFLDHYLDSVEWLCEPTEIEGESEAAFWLPVEHMRPQQHCARYSIPDRVLSFAPLNSRIAA